MVTLICNDSNVIIVNTECSEESKKPPWYLVDGAKAMMTALRSWTHKREVSCHTRWTSVDI